MGRKNNDEVVWNRRFQELKVYKKINGDCNVPRRYASNLSLGEWVQTQRRKGNEVSQERRIQLDSVGFTWKSNQQYQANHALWNKRFQELKDYKKIHGDCNVPTKRYKLNPSLGQWVQRQRMYKETMLEERKAKLNNIGFQWIIGTGQYFLFRNKEQSVNAVNNASWNQRFQELKDYKKQHGDCNVTKRNKLNPALGQWVQRQRSNREKMLDKRRAKLDNIGFQWFIGSGQYFLFREKGWRDQVINETNAALWNQRFQELKDYKQIHGDCDIPKSFKINPTLGRWVYFQRQRKTRGEMLEERAAKLNNIGFRWIGQGKHKLDHALWNQRFQELKDYKKQHGDCNVAKRDEFNPRLGRWIQKQRLHKETMLEERKAKLNKIGFQWVIGRGNSCKTKRLREQAVHETEGKEDDDENKNDFNNGEEEALHTLSRQKSRDSTLIDELNSTLKSWDDCLHEMKVRYFGGETMLSPAQIRVAKMLNNPSASEYDLVQTMNILNLELMELEGRVVKSTIGVVKS